MKPDEIEQLLGIYDIRCEAYWSDMGKCEKDDSDITGKIRKGCSKEFILDIGGYTDEEFVEAEKQMLQ